MLTRSGAPALRRSRALALTRSRAKKGCRLRRIVVLAAALAFSATSAHAQIRPNSHWKQIDSQHFRVVYEEGLDSLAQHAVRRAEFEHARLSQGLIKAPKGKIDLIITDATDITNGYATPLPSNRIVLITRPPVEELSLQYYDDWMDLVVTHELTHIFHMEQAGKVGRGLRTVFGRLPFTWPVFPILEQPHWTHEGLAVVIESQHTPAGRIRGSFHEMVIRTAVLENNFATIDRVSGETPIWPGGSHAYIYGSLFMDYIARKYGESAHTEIIKNTAGSIVPPSWRLDAIAKKATGKTYSDLYDEWHEELKQVYAAQSDSLRASGLTQAETITTTGRTAFFPRISRDGRFLAYADENGKQITATRVIDLHTKTDTRVRRNGPDPVTWLPDNSYITAQFQFDGPYAIFSDFYRVRGGNETRLTHGDRVETPDADRTGTRLVYVQNTPGSNRLMLGDTHGNGRVLVEASPDVQWTMPRWSPNGQLIAAQRWTRAHGHEIAILDTTGAVRSTINTTGVDVAPAWSPDGEWILFSSDRTGIANLYAARGSELRQITNVIGGAFYPEVSPDGRSIYYSAYHNDGFHIERIPFDATSWRAPQRESTPDAFRPDTIHPTINASAVDVQLSPRKNYSALRSGLPKFWAPSAFGDDVVGEFYGITTAGNDDVERHSYFAEVAYAPEFGRIAGDIGYSFAGLGIPVLTLDASRDWEDTHPRVVRNASGAIVDTLDSYKREDRLALTASFPIPRWRSNTVFNIGVEGAQFTRRLVGNARFVDPEDRLVGVTGGISFANYRNPAYAISPEDGVRISLFGRRRFEIDPLAASDASYSELAGSAWAYKSLDLFGFAHHVIALRGSGVTRTRIGPGPTDVGGVNEFLPVRGFESGVRTGFQAWSATAEWRLPLALVGRGYHLRPLFLDRLSAAAFVDAGNASCNAEQRAVYSLSCPGSPDRPTTTLVSAGAEVRAQVSILTFFEFPLRVGVAYPIRGEHEKTAEFYFTLSSW